MIIYSRKWKQDEPMDVRWRRVVFQPVVTTPNFAPKSLGFGPGGLEWPMLEKPVNWGTNNTNSMDHAEMFYRRMYRSLDNE